ncbi:hypothetical protein PB01_14475 [Psychrobacillus glaciei]|uniref:Selenocysteine lyase n=1 Tax=Psychrobacillus glaciei TaxID=2283160 RepID=A0A5J6SPE6_9BACI|nr:hypothetical protein [Psychrobacillus glaciei]QFF99928.1 hypothetical protein PB01_14465 [Psychrobacillus glaciei]QFF99930.1 hypothetical protein PB01_14475 [Psychrobacillus glaciei]
MFKTILFFIVVIAFYAISIWQYINPTKAIRLWFQPAYTEEPKVDEAYVRRSLIIRGIFFTLGFIVIIYSYFH